MNDLIEKAKAVKILRASESPTLNEDEIELALAYLDGEITASQVSKSFGITAPDLVRRALTQLYKEGRLVIKPKS